MEHQARQPVTAESPPAASVAQAEAQVSLVEGIEILGSPLLVQLLVGSYVGLVSGGRVTARGWVDMVAADGNTAWVWLDGGGGRRIVQADDGIGLTVMEEMIRGRPRPHRGHPHSRIGTTTEGN
jgi:hypothetical protein